MYIHPVTLFAAAVYDGSAADGYFLQPDTVPGSDEVLSLLALLFAVPLLISMAVSLLFWVFESIGLYRMAVTCRLRAPWLAWVPIASSAVLGTLGEAGDCIRGRRPLPYRILLPIGQAILTVGGTASIVLLVAVLCELPSAALYQTDAQFLQLGADILLLLAADLLLLLLSIVCCVFTYLALYRVFLLFAPDNAVLYTVLSILLPMSLPFLLFSLRDRWPCAPCPPAGAPQPICMCPPPAGAPQPPYGTSPGYGCPPPYGAPIPPVPTVPPSAQ